MLEKEARALQSILKSCLPSLTSSAAASTCSVTLSNGIAFSSFATPIQVLYLLLHPVDNYHTSRYCHRRSGRYYERLCIDLEQAGHWRQALFECQQALCDPSVKVCSKGSLLLTHSSQSKGSFVIGLTKRLTRLQLKESKQQRQQEQEEMKEEERTDQSPLLPSLESVLHVWCSVIGLDKECKQGHVFITAESKSELSNHRIGPRSSSLDQLTEGSQKKSTLKVKSSSTGMTIAKGESWSCLSCTYLNSSKTWRCEICRADRVQFPMKSETNPGPLPQEDESLDCPSSKRRGKTLPGNMNKRSKAQPPLSCGGGHSDARVDPYFPPSHSPSLSPSRVDVTPTAGAVSGASDDALMSDDQIDSLFFKLKGPTHLYQPPVVIMIGRRVGDMRMGKNLLIGPPSPLHLSSHTLQLPMATLSQLKIL
jgi:hypothetical protein